MQVRVSNRSAQPITLPGGCGLPDKDCWVEAGANVVVADEVVMKMGAFRGFAHLVETDHLVLGEIEPELPKFVMVLQNPASPPDPHLQPVSPPAAKPEDFMVPKVDAPKE